MSHFGDFMDGVPVKISEKYKRPLRFDLPYAVNECPIRAQNVVDSANYSCTFEKNVLAKLKELRTAKETKKNERRHRLQLLQEAEQKRLDAIAAAEDEERLKQLSVSEVSYPSTDEISPLSPDERADKACDNTAKVNTEHADVSSINYPSTSLATDSQLNILQPIQVKAHHQENSLLDDPDPLQTLKLNTKITKLSHNPNIDTLTFRDFENDTSSPFDNVELKTINDMELLAQVLQDQKDSLTSCHPPTSYVPDPGYTIPNCASQQLVDGVTYLPATYLEQPLQNTNMIYGSPQHYPVSNGYFIPTENDPNNLYIHNYQYYVPPNPYPGVEQYYGAQMPTTSGDISNLSNGSTYIPQPYYYQYPQVPVMYQPANAPDHFQAVVPNEAADQVPVPAGPQPTIKSRSRSVPDIVRELNEELAKLRMSERSYNASPAPKNQSPQAAVPATSDNKKVEKRTRRKSENLPNPFEKLPAKLQDMCRKIHGMGFPLDRVARVCTLVGDNDKKVIESLLILGDLMDLGFPEGKVSAALAKHEFNRDKALDELVP
uniref:UMA domain-containing protein n=1 Tax=Heliothis virescens TaxID=7102 RepID=A0A2A4JV78_HELVI